MSDLHNQILAFNDDLVKNESKYDIIKYITDINNLYMKKIDISFMEELMGFIGKDEPCIPHDLLVKYKVFSANNASNNIKNALDVRDNNKELRYIEGLDYRLLNVQEPVKQGGYNIRIIYYLHPKCFKKMLMRSRNSDKYADYYLLLEESIKYYNDYQIKYKDYIISGKDDKIDKLQITINKMGKDIVDVKDYNGKILNELTDAKECNGKILNELTEVKEELTEVKEELTDVKEELISSTEINIDTNNKLDRVCEHMAVPTIDLKDKPKFVILKSNTTPYKYYAMRQLERNVNHGIKVKKSEYPTVILNEYAPNGITMWKNIKIHELVQPYIKINRNTFELLDNITEDRFINNVKNVIDERYDTD